MDRSPASAPALETFARSSLLGSRATHVYSWFLRSLGLPGDVAECGVFRGETSRELVRHLEESGSPKTLYLFDSFAGLPDLATEEERLGAEGEMLRSGSFSAPLETVLDLLRPFRRFRIHCGLFAATMPSFARQLCFIHADADLYQSTVEIIRLADRCLVPGGSIVFDDYKSPFFPGVELAVERHLDPGLYEVTPSESTTQCFATRR